MMSGNIPDADRTIEALSAFLRATLTMDASADIRLSDELQLQELYLKIEQVRFRDRLAVEIIVPDELGNAKVPALLLQPLIENSIRHGVARSVRPVHIVVTASTVGAALIVTVENDGPDGAATGGHCMGLANVASRLALRYDGEAVCDHHRGPNGGFLTRIALPLQFDRHHRTLAA